MPTIYLDNAATSRFKPFCAKLSAINEIFFSANPGRSGHKTAIKAAMTVESCRDTISKYFFSGKTVFTKNCTEALNLAINGINAKKQLITTVFEHNSVLRPLSHLSKMTGADMAVLSPDAGGRLDAALKSRLSVDTSLVVLTAMSNVTGETIPIHELSKIVKENSSAYVLVDMSQGAGHIKPDFSYVDMIATSGHKSLHGLQGTGFLLIKSNVPLTPIIFGGTGTTTMSLDTSNNIPEDMEAGTLNTVGIASLNKGIEWTYKNFDQINNKISRLSAALTEGLRSIDSLKIYSTQNGILLCNFTNVPSTEIADILSEKYGICVRGGLHCAPLIHRRLHTASQGALRFSVGYNNSLTDIEKAVDAMKEISHNL